MPFCPVLLYNFSINCLLFREEINDDDDDDDDDDKRRHSDCGLGLGR